MNILKTVYLTVIALLLASCVTAPAEPVVRDEGVIRSVGNTSDVQTAIIKKHGASERYCAARQSDVADTRSVNGGLSIAGLRGGEGLSEGSSQGAIALGGRNPAVLIVREMMYRACELSLNLNSEAEQTLEIYKLFMEKTKEIAAIQTGPGSVALGQSGSSTKASSPNPTNSASSTTNSTKDATSNIIQGVD